MTKKEAAIALWEMLEKKQWRDWDAHAIRKALQAMLGCRSWAAVMQRIAKYQKEAEQCTSSKAPMEN